MAANKQQPPGQDHPEGGYGDRSRDANRERIQRRGDADDMESNTQPHHEGGHKIYEDRQQHDEADKNSEKNRLRRDRSRGGQNPGDSGHDTR